MTAESHIFGALRDLSSNCSPATKKKNTSISSDLHILTAIMCLSSVLNATECLSIGLDYKVIFRNMCEHNAKRFLQQTRCYLCFSCRHFAGFQRRVKNFEYLNIRFRAKTGRGAGTLRGHWTLKMAKHAQIWLTGVFKPLQHHCQTKRRQTTAKWTFYLKFYRWQCHGQTQNKQQAHRAHIDIRF